MCALVSRWGSFLLFDAFPLTIMMLGPKRFAYKVWVVILTLHDAVGHLPVIVVEVPLTGPDPLMELLLMLH